MGEFSAGGAVFGKSACVKELFESGEFHFAPANGAEVACDKSDGSVAMSEFFDQLASPAQTKGRRS